MSGDPTDFSCSFCGQNRKQTLLISGPLVFICPDCVDLCVDVIAEHAEKGTTVTMPALVERLRAELKQARDAATLPAWRPIETAPRDEKTPIFLGNVDWDQPALGTWRQGDWVDEHGWVINGATHWLPLSALPAVPR